MPLVNFSNVDFDQIKESIKDYLRSNSNFTDYDFEGSNLSTIIDTLAYNTYINSYNANMVTNEVFIDSATLRNNVVSLARNIGYVPRSRKASVANISFNVNASNTTAVSLTLKAGLVAVTNRQLGSTSYVFSIPSDITAPVKSNGIAEFKNVDIYQGTYITQDFTVSSKTPNQKFILDNAGVDTSLISVVVRESEQSTISRTFNQFDSLVDVTSTSPIYFLQEVDGERYELMFGDGIFGEKLQEPNYINASYIITNGEDGNGIDGFSFAGRIQDNNGNSITQGISLLSTNTASYGGSNIEGVESVRKYSTQIYSSQYRAVTATDFEAIVPQIYPETESVTAFGGEDLVPPVYGKVFVSIKPFNGVYLSSEVKRNLGLELRKYTVAGIVSELVDLKYLYVETNSAVYYNTNLVPSPQLVKSIVTTNINNYADSSQLNKFGARFKYSQFQKVIDQSHESITSNITTVDMRRDMGAKLDQFAEYEICYGNRFHVKNHGHRPVYNDQTIGFNIKSSGFKISGVSDTVYLGDTPNSDLKTGTVFLFKLLSPTEYVVVRNNIGIIDYIKGEIRLNPIKILSTVVNRGVPLVEISVTPYSNDVIGLQDLYLQLDPSNTVVNMINDRISSGDDSSGSDYIVSSSYQNNSLVRGTPMISSLSQTNGGTNGSSTATSSTTGSVYARTTVTSTSGTTYSY
jgi:hypothetical protein